MLEFTGGGPEVDSFGTPQIREMRRGLLVAVLAGRGAFTFTSWFSCAVVAVRRLPGREEAWPARRCCRRGAGPGERRRGLLVAVLAAALWARSFSGYILVGFSFSGSDLVVGASLVLGTWLCPRSVSDDVCLGPFWAHPRWL